MRERIFAYWPGWLALAGCLAQLISMLFGNGFSRWEEYAWVVIMATWVGNWLIATRTGRIWQRLYESERQRRLAHWS